MAREDFKEPIIKYLIHILRQPTQYKYFLTLKLERLPYTFASVGLNNDSVMVCGGGGRPQRRREAPDQCCQVRGFPTELGYF